MNNNMIDAYMAHHAPAHLAAGPDAEQALRAALARLEALGAFVRPTAGHDVDGEVTAYLDDVDLAAGALERAAFRVGGELGAVLLAMSTIAHGAILAVADVAEDGER